MPIVYSLTNPITEKMYYIGYTIMPLSQRLTDHIYSEQVDTTAEIKKSGKIPSISIIEEGDHVNKITEMYWIQHYLNRGYDLDNKIVNSKVQYEEKELTPKQQEILREHDIKTAYRIALEAIKDELPRSPSIPMVSRIQVIVETALSR